MIELPFIVGKKTKWISGINENTTCKVSFLVGFDKIYYF